MATRATHTKLTSFNCGLAKGRKETHRERGTCKGKEHQAPKGRSFKEENRLEKKTPHFYLEEERDLCRME